MSNEIKPKISPRGQPNHNSDSELDSDASGPTIPPAQTPRQQRAIRRQASTDSLTNATNNKRKYEVPPIPAFRRSRTPATGQNTANSTITKEKRDHSPISQASDGEASDTNSTYSKTRKTEHKPTYTTQNTFICRSLEDAINLCGRLSQPRKAAIEEYISSILNRNQLMVDQLKKLQNDLTKQGEINERLSRRLDALEAGTSSTTGQQPTKIPKSNPIPLSKPTYSQIAAKQTAKSKSNPSSVKELAKTIPTIQSRPPKNVIKIVPPPGTTNPERQITQLFNPADHNIKVLNLRTTSTKELIVRTYSSIDADKLSKATIFAKHGYKVSPVTLKQPKILIFGLNITEKQELVDQVYDQNEAFAGNDRRIFESKFRPIYSWRNNNKPRNWVVEVDPELRTAIMSSGARIFNKWQAHRVVDYIDATRCFKCQKYGHVAKHCQQQKEVCGHCAQIGHSYKVCPNKAEQPVCYTCKTSKLPAAHRIADKKCPTFLKAAKLQLTRTNYGEHGAN